MCQYLASTTYLNRIKSTFTVRIEFLLKEEEKRAANRNSFDSKGNSQKYTDRIILNAEEKRAANGNSFESKGNSEQYTNRISNESKGKGSRKHTERVLMTARGIVISTLMEFLLKAKEMGVETN